MITGWVELTYAEVESSKPLGVNIFHSCKIIYFIRLSNSIYMMYYLKDKKHEKQ
jgi:hypothetical protein